MTPEQRRALIEAPMGFFARRIIGGRSWAGRTQERISITGNKATGHGYTGKYDGDVSLTGYEGGE